METSMDPEGNEARARFRNAFQQFREAAKHLAGEIHRELPDFTVHDISHLDALWEMADLITGPGISLTPPEAFILGGAFLTHDLGMGLAAYPGGLDELRKSEVWRDAVAHRLMEKLGRKPRPAELDKPPVDIEQDATREALRALHAKQAARLPEVAEWRDRTGTTYHLIEDVQLRKSFGQLIGRLAYSHHWPVSKLGPEFSEVMGAPAWCPGHWKIEPLKLACLLRLADAAHIDARRAPGFLRAVRRLGSASDPHWAFQERMSQPFLKEDRLEYSSSSAFPLEEAPAWWLALDTLRMIDRELRQVDMLLADTGSKRFAARGVVGVEDPVRLAKKLRTSGWFPVDSRIRVSDVPSLVEHLGGEQLYGEQPAVPLRELIQNAADAVRGRRLVDDRDEHWGDITVRTGQDEHGEWLEVEDNGLGMSEEVLSGPLLDFGKSYWRSELAREEFPGLLAKGFRPTGRYGIGFFSVFMWGKRVRVTTQRYDMARQDTRVLEFDGGASSHPIVRQAASSEYLRDGGTRIRVWFSPPRSLETLLLLHRMRHLSLRELCAWLCPSLAVNLHVQEAGEKRTTAIGASDWLEADGVEFLKRTAVPSRRMPDAATLEEHARRLRVIRDQDGEPVGRMCVSMGLRAENEGGPLGTVTIGGLRATSEWPFAGVMAGRSTRAARDQAIPLVEDEEAARWASEQALLLKPEQHNLYDLYHAAVFLRTCGGDTASLPIAIGGSPWRWMNRQDVLEWSKPLQQIRLANVFGHLDMLKDDQFHPDVLLVSFGTPAQVSVGEPISYWPWSSRNEELRGWAIWRQTLTGAAIELISAAWGVPVPLLLSGLRPSLGAGSIPTEPIGHKENGTELGGWILADLRKPKLLAMP